MTYFAKTSPTVTLVTALALAAIVGCGRESATSDSAKPTVPAAEPTADVQTVPPQNAENQGNVDGATGQLTGDTTEERASVAALGREAAMADKVESTASKASDEPRPLPTAEEKAKDEDLVKGAAADKPMADREDYAGDAEDSSEDPEPPMEEPEPQMSPAEFLSKQFAPPPGAKRLSQESLLWVDRELSRVYIDGYVAIDRGALEMFACPVGSKEHESIVAVVAKSSEVHAALLVVGAKTGTTAMFTPNFVPPTGQAIRVWVSWRDKQGKYHVEDARRWVQDTETKKSVEADWVFAGSGFYKDEEDGREYYRADGGDMICVSNFSTAMMDLSLASSADADSLLFRPFEGRVPERGTPVRLILVPIPVPTDGPPPELTPEQDPNVKPKETVLPVREGE
ncbi:YdjY domain-containing protein [Novipirellula caenicola]|uniref:Secreted protein n=1 Tax=Novipirellula caenicola TaxID=1536901 RepID=A0ABP9VJT8_9BACT